jgi:hypothetical protein
MPLFIPPAAPTLPAWLETATLALVPSAKTRIRAEIEAHYADAVASHLLNGVSEPVAQAAALASLGDARAAGRRFRQNHLMTYEANLICNNVIWYQGRYTVIDSFLFFCLALFTWAIQPKCDFPPLWLIVALLLAYSLVGMTVGTRNLALARRKTTTTVVRRLLLNHLIHFSFYIVWAIVYFCGVRWQILHGKTPDFGDFFPLVIAICLVLYLLGRCLMYSEVRRKLLSAGEDWNAPPPRHLTLA